MAVSDETSVAGRAGLVDQAQFGRAALAIEQACRALSDSSSNQQQVSTSHHKCVQNKRYKIKKDTNVDFIKTYIISGDLIILDFYLF